MKLHLTRPAITLAGLLVALALPARADPPLGCPAPQAAAAKAAEKAAEKAAKDAPAKQAGPAVTSPAAIDYERELWRTQGVG